jgi:hypothetical protein
VPLLEAELIKIKDVDIGNGLVQTVDARDLHAFLGIARDLPTWIASRISQFNFEAGIDYEVFPEMGGNPTGGRPSEEYVLSLDMAKELADEYDAAQARGEVASSRDGNLGRSKAERPKKKATTEEIGLTRKQIHEARKVRDPRTVIRASFDAPSCCGRGSSRTDQINGSQGGRHGDGLASLRIASLAVFKNTRLRLTASALRTVGSVSARRVGERYVLPSKPVRCSTATFVEVERRARPTV